MIPASAMKEPGVTVVREMVQWNVRLLLLHVAGSIMALASRISGKNSDGLVGIGDKGTGVHKPFVWRTFIVT